MPPALEQHLEDLMQAIPGNQGMSLEGPGSAAEAAFRERAYPADTISVAQVDRSKAAFGSAFSRPFPTGKAQEGRLDQRRARARRSTRSPSSATSFNYVPNEYVAGGRTTSIAISHVCLPFLCRAWITPAGGGVWGTLNILAAEPQLELPRRPAGHQRRRRGRRSTATTRPATPSTSAPARPTSAAPAASPASASTSRPTAASPGPARSARPSWAARASARSSSSPATRKTLYVGDHHGAARHVERLLHRRDPAGPGRRRSGACTSPPTAAQTWTFIHNGAADRGRVHRQRRPSSPTPRPARRAACGTSSSTRPTRTSSTPRRTRAASGARPTPARPGRRSSRRSTPTVIQTRPAFDVTKLPNGKTRMYVHEGNIGTPYSRLFRSDDVATGAPVVHRPDQRQRGRPGLRHVQPVRPASAGTTCSSTRPTGTRTSSTPAARTATARRIANKRGRGPVHRRRASAAPT